jgi:hypothetical protein
VAPRRNIGDFDCSGEDVERDWVTRTRCWARVERVLLTDEQRRAYELPATEGKRGDPRWPAFAARYGFDVDHPVQWEVEALEPSELRRLVLAAVEPFRTRFSILKAVGQLGRSRGTRRLLLTLVRRVQGTATAVWVSVRAHHAGPVGMPLMSRGLARAYTRAVVELNVELAGEPGWEPLPTRLESTATRGRDRGRLRRDRELRNRRPPRGTAHTAPDGCDTRGGGRLRQLSQAPRPFGEPPGGRTDRRTRPVSSHTSSVAVPAGALRPVSPDGRPRAPDGPSPEAIGPSSPRTLDRWVFGDCHRGSVRIRSTPHPRTREAR